MIKLKDLLIESFVMKSKFKKIISQATKESGKKPKIPSDTKKLAQSVKRLGINKKVDDMYLYYAYVQGWGGSFKSISDWLFQTKDKNLLWIRQNKWDTFGDDYLSYTVNTDMMAAQLVGDLYKGQKGVEDAYYLVKDYFNSFGMSRGRSFDKTVDKVSDWMKKNKIETL